MLSRLPALIFDPKPPESFGQRNARTAAPKPLRPRTKAPTMPRLRNWRRVTPSVSGSIGGSIGSWASVVVAGRAPRCSTSVFARRSISRPLGTAPAPTSTSAADSSLRSFWMVSRERRPVARSMSRRRPVVSTMTNARKMAATIAMAMMVDELMVRGNDLQVEEEPVTPGQREVEARPPEERADDDEDRPEHDEDREEC